MLQTLKGNYAQERKFIIPGIMTANKTKEQCFENFLSPFGSHGNYVKVLFKIKIDTEGKDNCRTTFMNLCAKGKNMLTMTPDNEQVLFAMPQFAI